MKKYQILGENNSLMTKEDKDDCECYFGRKPEEVTADTLEEAQQKAIKLIQASPTYKYYILEVKCAVQTRVKAEDIAIDEV